LEEAIERVVQSLDGPLPSISPFLPASRERLTVYLEPSPYGDDGRMSEVGARLRTEGWDVHVAGRFDSGYVFASADADWTALSQASIAVVDVRGPETPPGAAMTIGACAATAVRPCGEIGHRCHRTAQQVEELLGPAERAGDPRTGS
jgi:hypothetical protein